jgi:hypothetical protein
VSKRGAVWATFAAVIMFVATAAAPAAVAAFRAASRMRPIAWENLKDVEQISRDTLPAASGSEADTQIEPDIAFDPNHPRVIVAVFQQGRFPNGGSVDPGFATSHDGGRTWVTGNLPGLTTAVGG